MTDPDADRDLVAALVDEPALRRAVDASVPGDGPFTVTRITSGLSNELFRLQRGGGSWVLRRPPRVPHSPRAHDMAREFRVLRALEGSSVPHPRPLAFCGDPDVIGAPFYVMEEVDGVRLYDGLPAGFESPQARRAVAEALVDSLADLHRFDWDGAGLGDLGHPEGFTERQASRWAGRLAAAGGREFPGLDEAVRWLGDHVPAAQRTSLVHGDYGLHNVLYGATGDPRLRAVVDWETATIGDPLVDAGYLFSLWLDEGERARWFASALPYAMTGFPSRDELVARYAARTGLDPTELRWYRAVSQLKMTAILEGSYVRYLAGGTDREEFAALEHDAPNHAEHVVAIVRGEA